MALYSGKLRGKGVLVHSGAVVCCPLWFIEQYPPSQTVPLTNKYLLYVILV